MVRDHRLVGSDQRLAGLDGGARTGQRWSVRAADQFDHNVYVLAVAEDDHVVFPGIGREVDTAIPVAVARADGGNHDRTASPARNQRGIGFDKANNACPDGSQASKADAQRLYHDRSLSRAHLGHSARKGQTVTVDCASAGRGQGQPSSCDSPPRPARDPPAWSKR